MLRFTVTFRKPIDDKNMTGVVQKGVNIEISSTRLLF